MDLLAHVSFWPFDSPNGGHQQPLKRSRIKLPSRVNSEEPGWRIFIPHSVWVEYSAHMFLWFLLNQYLHASGWYPLHFGQRWQRPGDYPQTTLQLQNWCVEFLWFSLTLCGRGVLSYFPTSTTILRWEFNQGVVKWPIFWGGSEYTSGNFEGIPL